MHTLKTILQAMRIPFLILTPMSVLLGFAVAIDDGVLIAHREVYLIPVGALLSHISVNTFNEYFDFRSGLDAKTTKTPFSGGSGALVVNPQAANAVFCVAVLSLALTILIGLFFVVSKGMLLFPIGLAGVIIIITYTQWINRHPLLCLLAPGIAFGPLMVIGTYVILAGQYSAQIIWISMLPCLLASNLLLLNQLPDITADQTVGRRHIPIVYGTEKAAQIYAVFSALAAGVIVAGIYLRFMPLMSALALVPIGFCYLVYLGVCKNAASIPSLIPYLGMNVAITVITPLIVGLSIVYA